MASSRFRYPVEALAKPKERALAEQVVTIKAVFPNSGQNAKGPWTRYDIKDAGGNKYQTFNDQLGKKAEALKGQSVKVTYHEETRGDYTNNVLDSIGEAGAGEATKQHVYTDDRQVQIMRQSGLERAIRAASLLGLNLNGVDELYDISDEFVRYFQEGQQEPTEDAPRF